MGRVVQKLMILLALGCLAALVPAAAASAADSVFWSNWQGASFGRAALTGGGSDLAPTPNPAAEPYGSAIDAATGKFYWADTATNTIRYANLDGSGSAVLPTTGATVDQPNSTVVDLAAGRVYWANAFDDTIAWANLDGSGGGDVPTGTAPIETPYGIAIDPATNRVYWANYQGVPPSIGYANLDGSGGGELAVPAGLLAGADGLGIDPASQRIYWTNFEANQIGWADLNGVGGGILPIASGLVDGPTGLAIESAADRLLWANEEGDSIGSAALDGSGGVLLDTTGATLNYPAYPTLLKAPVSNAAPSLSGGTAVGSVLTCTPGTWAGDLIESQLYRAPQTIATGWILNGATLNGATGSTLTATQPGTYACRSTATNGAGSTTATSGTITVAAPPAATTPPPIAVSLLKVKFDKRHGTATVLAKVSGPGTLTLTGKKVVKRSVKTSGAGIAKLKVASKGGALKTLIKAGSVKVRIRIGFLATEGARVSVTRKITLRRAGGGRGTP